MTLEEKLNQFAAVVEADQKNDLRQCGLDCQANLDNCKAKVVMGKKYAKVDVGTSGKYMVEIDTQKIFGIKGYGVIHRGHYYGTLDETDQLYWGRFHAQRKV